MLSAQTRVLVVEDDRVINRVICRWLRDIMSPDFEAVAAHSLQEGEAALNSRAFDVVILDRVLGDGDGIGLLRMIRGKEATRDLPVIILSGLGEERDAIQSLQLGADDFIHKPCSEAMFRARLLAVLRRNRDKPAKPALMKGPGFQLDPAEGRLRVDGRDLHLEPKEVELLLLLLRRPNVIHSAEFLCVEVWGRSAVPHNSLETRLSSLRRKLGARAACLETVRGSGYRLRA